MPAFVAKRWRADCQKAAKSVTPFELGRVRITQNATEVSRDTHASYHCLRLIHLQPCMDPDKTVFGLPCASMPGLQHPY